MDDLEAKKYFDDVAREIKENLRQVFGSEIVDNLEKSPVITATVEALLHGECCICIKQKNGGKMNTDRFKFRVWDNHCKRYGLPPYIRRSREDCYIYDVETPQENPELVQHHFVLEQCTGVKDKNGKLIFEGDVLKVPAFPWGFVNMWVVWDDSNCRWDLKYTGKRSVEKDMTVLVDTLGNASEVIGNIHENGD